MTPKTFTDDLHLLLQILPCRLKEALETVPKSDLLEIILDLGRSPQARFPGRSVDLAEEPVTHDELDDVVAALGEFDADNRAGIEGTLHRISALRNRKGQVIGLTLRVGRAVVGTIDLIRDLVERGDNLLLLGKPGIGKTTKLREIARVLAEDFAKRVVVIDTSNEIAGDGDVPHPAIGSARRMQVSHPERQHAVMIEAVENHMPEVIVVDEIGTAAEAAAARTIAERGVQLVGTAHGNTLENLVMNPTLSDLVGGVETVTLGDDEARIRSSQKTINERRSAPTFDAVLEIVHHHEVIVHADTARAVDKLLLGMSTGGVRRTRGGMEPVSLPRNGNVVSITLNSNSDAPDRNLPRRIYLYAIGRDLVDRMLRDLRLGASIVRRAEQADVILALRKRADDPRLKRILATTGAPLLLVKKNTTAQIRRTLQEVFNIVYGVDDREIDTAIRETEAAINTAITQGVAVELSPQKAKIRRLQHRIAMRSGLVGESVGSEPLRHLVIHPKP